MVNTSIVDALMTAIAKFFFQSCMKENMTMTMVTADGSGKDGEGKGNDGNNADQMRPEMKEEEMREIKRRRRNKKKWS